MEKNFKKSSERKKVRQSQDRRGKYQRSGRGRRCEGRVTESDNSEKFEKNFKKSSERKKVRQSQDRRGKYPQKWFKTWRTCVRRATTCP